MNRDMVSKKPIVVAVTILAVLGVVGPSFLPRSSDEQPMNITTSLSPQSSCKDKFAELEPRIIDWFNRWDYSTTDPGGQIRIDGRNLADDMSLAALQCTDNDLYNSNNITYSIKELLNEDAALIHTEIDKDINYGPPCVPTCKSGPPIT